mmetsp:Transcript_8198/g.24434  ORF Transcript_8198/g.24434 Transcript_8198/m.24434 type:complete len:461 (+) Transcript_8198:141-1523(+)
MTGLIALPSSPPAGAGPFVMDANRFEGGGLSAQNSPNRNFGLDNAWINSPQSLYQPSRLGRFAEDPIDILAGLKSPASLLSPNRSPHASSPCPPIFKPSPRGNATAIPNTPGAMLEATTGFLSPPVIRHAGNLPVPGPQVGGIPAGFGGSQGRSPARLSSRRVLQFGSDTDPPRQAPARSSFPTRASSERLGRKADGLPFSSKAAAGLRGGTGADEPSEAAVMIETSFMQPIPVQQADLLQPAPALKLNSTALASPPDEGEPSAVSGPNSGAVAAATSAPAQRPRRRTARASGLVSSSGGGEAVSEEATLDRSSGGTPAKRRGEAPSAGGVSRGSLASVVPPDTPDDAVRPTAARRSSAGGGGGGGGASAAVGPATPVQSAHVEQPIGRQSPPISSAFATPEVQQHPAAAMVPGNIFNFETASSRLDPTLEEPGSARSGNSNPNSARGGSPAGGSSPKRI